jgi:hypothetical protein
LAHRAAQIVDAIASIVQDRVRKLGVKVYAHRRLSLDPEQDELPAISIDYGEDRRGEQQLQMIASMLAVETTAIAIGSEEAQLRRQLLDYRAEVHLALMADPRLGLPDVVVTTSYGGAAAPIFDYTGELLAGELTATWLVIYRMNILDPN